MRTKNACDAYGKHVKVEPSLVPLNTWSDDNEKIKELTIENCIAMLDEVL